MLLKRLESLSKPSEYDISGVEQDCWSELPFQVQSGWKRVLSSIATTESYERIVLEPLIKAFKEPQAITYLIKHAEDEVRHGKWLTDYLKLNFKFTKRSPTLSDRVFYQGLIPRLSKMFVHYPKAGILALYAYEKFAIGLYDLLLKDAEKRRLEAIEKIIRAILRDEGKHVAGLENLLRLTEKASPSESMGFFKKPNQALEAHFGKLCLMVVRADLRFGPLGPHNSDLCRHLEMLGISPKTVDELSSLAVVAAGKLNLKHGHSLANPKLQQ